MAIRLSDLKASGGGLKWEVTSSAITADTNKGYLVDVSSSALTIALPPSPKIGDQVGIKDYTGNSSTNNITISGNGNNIEGGTSNFVIATNKRGSIFVYSGTAQGWSRVSEVYGPAIYE